MTLRLLLIIGFFAARSAHASAFLVPSLDADAMARGNAFIANPTNGSAIWYNPAGVANLQGLQINVGANLIAPSESFKANGVTTNALHDTFVAPELYLTYRITDVVSVGLGLDAPFGGSIRWAANTPAADIARQQTIQALYLSPELALNFSRWVKGLSIGGGVDLVSSQVYLNRDIPFGNATANLALSGSTFGIGGRGGIIYRPIDMLSIGVVYRSPIGLSFNNGVSSFTAPPEYRTALPPDGTAKTAITLPQTIGGGVAVRPIAGLELEADVNWTNWSVVQSLKITLADGSSQSAPKNYSDTFGIGVGGDYAITKALAIRAGFAWEQSPIPASTVDFTLPDATHYTISVGLGYEITHWLRADAYFAYLLPTSITTAAAAPVQGTYSVQSALAGLNLTFAFAKPKPAAEAPASTPTN